jgi:predicted esterase YcpF (UPF0227 family)
MVIDAAKISHHDIADSIRPFIQGTNVDCIYYCHGFASHFDGNKDKIRALSAAAIVDGNTVDYTLSPHEVFASFTKALSPLKKCLFVGTSMGGFLAAWLGSELGCPFVAINPASNPAASLQKHIGAFQCYSGAQCVLKKETVDAYSSLPFRMDGNGFVAIDMGDKIIDPQQTLRMVGNKLPVVTFPEGSHRFDHMPQLTAVIRSTFFDPAPSKNMTPTMATKAI